MSKAVVLAAGFGTRLCPLTYAVPKPLLPVWGEPMLARIVDLLRGWGVDDIVVNCHYLSEQVEAWCAANGCRASREPEILGTGGVLNPLRGWIGSDDFYLVNGDIVVEGLGKPIDLDGSEDVIGTCYVTEAGPRTIEVEPESGFVTNWKSDDAGFPGTFTYCGIARLKADILDYVEPTGFSSIVQAYERAMADNRFVRAVCPKKMLWTDAGTVASYIDVNRDGDDNAFEEIPQLKRAGVRKAEFLGARGSNRLFFREGDRVIILYDDVRRGENARYAGHARWLKGKGVPVPEVLVDSPADRTLVMTWVGNEKKMTFDECARVVEELERFGRLGTAARAENLSLEHPFDATLYGWERDLFTKHCLGALFQMDLSAAVETELKKVAALLEKEPMALVHRDFQSTNVLWRNGEPSFIDFQGMRFGPAVYDLASFVYDPYVVFSDERRQALAALFARQAGRADVVKVLPFAAVQRLVQCLGAYGRLASVGQPGFLKHVVPALQNLLTAADEAGLDVVGALAEDLIARADHEHHHHRHFAGS